VKDNFDLIIGGLLLAGKAVYNDSATLAVDFNCFIMKFLSPLVLSLVFILISCSPENDEERRMDAFRKAYKTVWDKQSPKIIALGKSTDYTSQVRALFSSEDISEEQLRQKVTDFMSEEDDKLTKISQIMRLKVIDSRSDPLFDYQKTIDSLYVKLDVHPLLRYQLKEIKQDPGYIYMKEVVTPELMKVMKEYDIDPDEFGEFVKMKKKYLSGLN